jgi:hypothetical protein
MEPEGSLPHSQVPATCLYPEPAQSSPVCEYFITKIGFHGEGLWAPSPNPPAGGQAVVCDWGKDRRVKYWARLGCWISP